MSRSSDLKHLFFLVAVTARGSARKRTLQALHASRTPDTAAAAADQECRKYASTPATGANTVPLHSDTRQPFADQVATIQPLNSVDMQSAAHDQQSSSSVDV